ncbi:MAG: hypothetical protein AAGF88_03645 [Pseudomonadota bacterium]
MSLSPEEEAQAAEQVAATVVSRVYPGLSVAPVANCVRDNATRDERRALASYRNNVGGEAQIITLRIIDRPETNACVRANGIILS